MAKKTEAVKDRISLTLRLDADVHEALRLIAAKEMRSLNTQIEYYLRNAVLDYDVAYNSDKKSLYAVIQRVESSVGIVPADDTSQP